MKMPSMLARFGLLVGVLLLGISGCRFAANPSPGSLTLVAPVLGSPVLFILVDEHSTAAMRMTEAFAAASARPGERLVILSIQSAAVLASSAAPPPPTARVPAPPKPLGSHPTTFQKARYGQAVLRYRQTVRRSRTALLRQQQKVLSAWAESTAAEAFARSTLQSAGAIDIDRDLRAVATDLFSMRQAGAGGETRTVIAIASVTGAVARSAPVLPIGLQGSTVVAEDFPGSSRQQAAWQASLLQTGASRVVLLAPVIDSQMATVVDEGLDNTVTDTLTSVLFRLGQYTIQEAALPQLLHLRYLLMVKYRQATLTINGYTDNLPAAMPGGNLALSRLRAEHVRKWLIAHGVSADRIQAFGYGDTDPVAPNTPHGQPMNRRVVVVIDPDTTAGAD